MKKLKFSDIKEVIRYEWDCPECGEENFDVRVREELYCWECDDWIEVEEN